MSVHKVKTPIRLGICQVWIEYLLCTQWVNKDIIFHNSDSKDADQTEVIPKQGFS